MLKRGYKTMKTIAFINQKGGVGKSICALNIGAFLAKEYGKKVLFIDLDAQSTLTDLVVPGIEFEGGTYDLFTKNKNSYTIITGNGYDIIPSTIDLVNLDSKDISASKLKDRLSSITGYDYIILDCPPSLGIININALTAANVIISIIKPDIVSSRGLSLLNNTLLKVDKRKKIDAVIINQYKRRKISDLTIELIKQDYRVLNTLIRDTSALSESASIAKDIIDYNTNNNGYNDFKDITKELIKGDII